jgi:hypothetical protein
MLDQDDLLLLAIQLVRLLPTLLQLLMQRKKPSKR